MHKLLLKRVAPRCLLKINLRKAYDSVGWQFLKGVFEGLHFPSRFIQWIMECVTYPTYSVALNGSLHASSKVEKASNKVSLSSFLFVLCLEYFSRMVKAASNDSEFNYHPKCGPLKITHLTFSDDLLLFARRDVMPEQIIMDCLSNFGLVSGLRMNILKFSLYKTRIHGRELDDILELTNFPKDTMPFYYLGIPLALENPKGSKKPLVAWRDVCLPKDEGSLGLKDMKSWNSALLAKSLWNIHQKKDTLWRRWVVGDSSLIQSVEITSSQHAVATQNNELFQEVLDRFKAWPTGEKFCTKMAYDYFQPRGTKRIWAVDVWKSCITSKHSFLLWLWVQSKLLTKGKLQYLEIDQNCVLCGHMAENRPTLIF
ncbi:uncharacterized protein LOC111411379 [Olea europaea var. sylvestris]|uniref:uncharacterized protein LOC111411379 n=1 Tax=Olea europaea var. sylvestris TaxID=158386 RepID=UPI000C1D3949|nr:uncharacterized protein LOC111411379 [Olea europaea var. sylvestris]